MIGKLASSCGSLWVGGFAILSTLAPTFVGAFLATIQSRRPLFCRPFGEPYHWQYRWQQHDGDDRQRNKALKTMVAQAVAFEPVSVREFPANRERTGNFQELPDLLSKKRQMAASPRASGCKFPTNKTGNYFRGTEKLSPGTGISMHPLAEVRFSPESGRVRRKPSCLLRANSGHRTKVFN